MLLLSYMFDDGNMKVTGQLINGRYGTSPILKPVKEHSWESKYVFNPAMFALGGKIHFLYRAMGEDNVSRLGYASSSNGYYIDERLNYPVFEPTTFFEKKGVEDARVTVINDECFMTFTAYNEIPQVGITSISTHNLLMKKWSWGEHIYPFSSVVDKDAVIFPKMMNGMYVMIHRPDPDMCIIYSKNLREWGKSKILMKPRQNRWDCLKIGAAGPPIEIDEGWLQIYHGVDNQHIYRLGAILLEKDDPEKIIYRTDKPFLEPYEEYECEGQVPNVVFSCGAIKNQDNILISYGCADSVIGISSFKIDEILI